VAERLEPSPGMKKVLGQSPLVPTASMPSLVVVIRQ